MSESFSTDSEQPIVAPIKGVRPKQPKGPLLVSHITSNSITLEWNKSDLGRITVDYYDIEKLEIDEDGDWTHVGRDVGNMKSPYFTVNGLKPGKAYLFRVIAVNSAGTSEALYHDCMVVTNAASPNQPGGPLSGYLLDDHLYLTWKHSDNILQRPVVKYVVEILNSKSDKWTELGQVHGDVNVPIMKVEDLNPNARYNFRVFAQNRAGKSDPLYGEIKLNILADKFQGLSSQNYTYKLDFDPKIPQGPLKVHGKDETGFTLSWKKPTSGWNNQIETYLVEMLDLKRGGWSKVGNVSPHGNLTLTVPGLKSTRKYLFRIRSVIGGSHSSPLVLGQPISLMKEDESCPDVIITSEINDDNLKLSWNRMRSKIEHESFHFYVIEQMDIDQGEWIVLGTVKEKIKFPEFKVLNLQPNKKYIFRITTDNKTFPPIFTKKIVRTKGRPVRTNHLLKGANSTLPIIEEKSEASDHNESKKNSPKKSYYDDAGTSKLEEEETVVSKKKIKNNGKTTQSTLLNLSATNIGFKTKPKNYKKKTVIRKSRRQSGNSSKYNALRNRIRKKYSNPKKKRSQQMNSLTKVHAPISRKDSFKNIEYVNFTSALSQSESKVASTEKFEDIKEWIKLAYLMESDEESQGEEIHSNLLFNINSSMQLDEAKGLVGSKVYILVPHPEDSQQHLVLPGRLINSTTKENNVSVEDKTMNFPETNVQGTQVYSVQNGVLKKLSTNEIGSNYFSKESQTFNLEEDVCEQCIKNTEISDIHVKKLSMGKNQMSCGLAITDNNSTNDHDAISMIQHNLLNVEQFLQLGSTKDSKNISLQTNNKSVEVTNSKESLQCLEEQVKTLWKDYLLREKEIMGNTNIIKLPHRR